MRKLKIYKDGSRYFDGGLACIYPADVDPVREYNLESLTDGEFKELQKKPKDKRLLKKAKRIKKKHGA